MTEIYESLLMVTNMVDSLHGKKVGRPRKYTGGWESVNRRICNTYEEWKRVKEQQSLQSDDSVAQHLLAYLRHLFYLLACLCQITIGS